MAANQFATMLHRNTNKITLILIYAVLEWTLILLLLLNSLFTYLIIRFANYFGLKPPCLWCSRVDHLFDHHGNIHRDLLCETHATEISKLGFCSKHQKLAEQQHMCQDCSPSHNFSLFPRMKDNKMTEIMSLENGGDDLDFNCSCCGVSFLESKFSTPYILIKRSWDDLEFTKKGNLICEEDDVLEKGDDVEVEKVDLEIPNQHLEFFIDCSGHTLVPVEDESKNQENDETKVKAVSKEYDREPKFTLVEPVKIEEDENDLVFYTKDSHEVSLYHQVQILAAKEREEEDEDEDEQENSDVPPDEVPQITNDDTDGEVSIGTEIPDLDLVDEQPSTSSTHFCTKEDQETAVKLKMLSVDLSSHGMNDESSICCELNEMEEDKVPNTPTSTDSFYQLHRKLLLEKKDSDSVDGSVVSELESGDAASAIEHLKSTLKSERKALHSLYSELEEERSASAVAASQTMAMINRLQEEKAAMQMEALQYQRMMEEQSEYDQEALQLMNELMVKREKEKQELEKELDVYRKRLLEYETKEKMRMLKSSTTSGFSSEDSDGLSIDLNQDAKEDDTFYTHQQALIPVDAVINLDDSLADFEEERMAILEQLKVLEEKLIIFDDQDSYHENGNHVEEDSHFHREMNGHVNGFLKEMDGKHSPDGRIVNAKGKKLLPLFDSMSDDTLNGHENGYHSGGVHEKVALEEELDNLHERLQSLEADREFLKNCIGSLKKGDKGMDLLQEILQHLRDLRNVELRARSLSDGVIV